MRAKDCIVRCGVRTHALSREPELKSGALDHSANLTRCVGWVFRAGLQDPPTLACHRPAGQTRGLDGQLGNLGRTRTKSADLPAASSRNPLPQKLSSRAAGVTSHFRKISPSNIGCLMLWPLSLLIVELLN